MINDLKIRRALNSGVSSVDYTEGYGSKRVTYTFSKCGFMFLVVRKAAGETSKFMHESLHECINFCK